MNVLINEARIEKRVNELAKEINSDYEGEELVLLGVLKGSVVFLVDLAKKLKIDVSFEFVDIEFDEENNGKVSKDLKSVIEGKNILIVEDIIDTGKTITFLKQHLENLEPKSLEIATLLAKPSRKIEELNVKYIGFGIHDQFVLGYGMDYKQLYRNLPYVGSIEEF